MLGQLQKLFKPFSEQKPRVAGSYQKIKFQIAGMHCPSCSMNIDGVLEETKGVIEVNTSYARATCQVIYDSKQVGIDQLRDTIEKAGYKCELINV